MGSTVDSPTKCAYCKHKHSLVQWLNDVRGTVHSYAQNIYLCNTKPCSNERGHDEDARIAYRAFDTLLNLVYRAIKLAPTVAPTELVEALIPSTDTVEGAFAMMDLEDLTESPDLENLGYLDGLYGADDEYDEDDLEYERNKSRCQLMREIVGSLDCFGKVLEFISSQIETLSEGLPSDAYVDIDDAYQNMQGHFDDMHYEWRMFYKELGRALGTQLLTALCGSARMCNKNIEVCTSEPCNNAPGHIDDAKTACRLLAGTIHMLGIALSEQDYGPDEQQLDDSERSGKLPGGTNDDLPFMWSPPGSNVSASMI